MRLAEAYLCMNLADCDEIGTSSQICPKCGGQQLWPLANFLNRPTEEWRPPLQTEDAMNGNAE